MSRTLWTTLLAATLAAPIANAGPTWTFDVTTTGQDVTWNSPTAVDPSASVYAVDYTITLVEVDVTWNGIPFNNIDVTGQVPSDLLSASFEVDGPAPVAALSQPVVVPPPPDPPAITATLSMGLNASGFGFASATNVTLGSLSINLGGIFGTQTVLIKSVRLVGQLTIHDPWFDLGFALAGSTGTPSLAGSGTLVGGDPLTLELSGAAANRPVLFVIGLSQINVPFEGGTMVPSLNIILNVATNGAGTFTLPANWPNGIPAGTSVYMQCWVTNPAGTMVDGASNGLRAVAQ